MTKEYEQGLIRAAATQERGGMLIRADKPR
jgi:hypothetical protein